MNPEYKELRAQADKLYYRYNDVVDQKSAAGTLTSNVRNIVEDFEMNKNPRSVEDRVKQVIEELKGLRHELEAMDIGHIDELVKDYEDLRQEVRGLSNY